jgi:hypothetical protein
MYNTTDGVLDANQGLFARLDELTAAHLKFKGFLVKIRDYRQVQEADQSGLTETKAILRNKLGTLTLKCISALKAYGVATQDEVLLGKVNYSKSKVGKLKDPVFADVAHLILTEAQGRLAELSKFFVTEEDLAEIQVLETEFRAAIPRKRMADSVSKVSTQNIAEIFDAVDQLLKEELDVLMAPFEFTEPDFYRAYKNARIIVNYSGGGPTPEEPETEEPQPEN